jgi:hypothetical protein
VTYDSVTYIARQDKGVTLTELYYSREKEKNNHFLSIMLCFHLYPSKCERPVWMNNEAGEEGSLLKEAH